MSAIEYKLVFHRGEHRILVLFQNISSWNTRIKTVAGARWSRTLKGWTIPDTPENRNKCGLSLQTTPAQATPVAPAIQQQQQLMAQLSSNNAAQLQRFIQHLTLKAYSSSTIRTYRNEFIQLLQLLGKIPVQDLQPEHLQRYILYCISNGLSENSVHSRINALKFYYEQVLHNERMFFDMPRPKKPLQLPGVFNKAEIAAIINCVENLKQKTILLLSYACGMRVGEVVSLRISDIDSNRMILHIHAAKGKKDRIVSISPTLVVMLRAYYRQYKPHYYLFEGQSAGMHYSTRSIQIVLQRAKEKAKITKPGSMHQLRHSFATHLLDKGIDVVMIQKLLGHNDIKTTLRYLHVTNRDLQKVLSPLEDIAMLIKTNN